MQDGVRPVTAPRRLEQTFLHALVQQFEGYATNLPDAAPHYRVWLQFLEYEGCKRVLFDARQALTFAELAAPPPEGIQRQLRLPFPAFYMEFTEPVQLPLDSWSVESHEFLRAMLVATGPRISVWQPPTSLIARPSYVTVKPIVATAFITNLGGSTFTDRTWRTDLATGATYTMRSSCEALADATTADRWDRGGNEEPGLEVRYKNPETDRSTGLSEIGLHDFFPAGFQSQGRVVGWWERASLAGSSLLQWVLAYMMAKSIVIEQAGPPVSRQQRRLMARGGMPPSRPWHVVKVDPRYRRSYDSEDAGRSHSYRYDVIGHLRLGRHRAGVLPDGTRQYVETIEWIPPHQRGLANNLYVPKTYSVAAGRRVPPVVRGTR